MVAVGVLALRCFTAVLIANRLMTSSSHCPYKTAPTQVCPKSESVGRGDRERGEGEGGYSGVTLCIIYCLSSLFAVIGDVLHRGLSGGTLCVCVWYKRGVYVQMCACMSVCSISLNINFSLDLLFNH